MEDKYKRYGIIGTLIFHGLILLCLIFAYVSTRLPEELGGIMVNFGNSEDGSGLYEPNLQPVQEVTPEVREYIPEPQVDESVLAQEVDQSVFIAEAKKKEEERKRQEEAERKKAEEEKKRREEQAKADAINRLAVGAFNTGSQQTGQGNTSGVNNQGNPFGNSNQGSNQGIGGAGGGPSFSLEGRTAEGLPRPNAAIKEEGRIVVNITVNPRGNVIFAEVGAGTNISDAAMRSSAIDAAKKSKFNTISATNNQSGTITYRYSLR
ncbi:MAG: energy transducer TonB [Candidatus Azobacteroides sp.]|nr:energy transducer TonB [Candidatus Azobacteroides sp.]